MGKGTQTLILDKGHKFLIWGDLWKLYVPVSQAK